MAIEIRTLRNNELGNSTHLIIDRDSSSAVVIDPVRDIADYLEIAETENVEITWALETHVHNDFVSGARELVAAKGAQLGASAQAGLHYPYGALTDGDELEIGTHHIRVLATPGHTPEHVAYLLLDPSGTPKALFSGGALMVGTAARTDLFGPALSWRFAHDLERSLKEKILSLPDDVAVYPTHGGGSFCAVGAGSAWTTTIGAERSANALAQSTSSREFVTRSLTGGTYPSYYVRMRSLNQSGAPLLGSTPADPPALDLQQVDEWLAQGAVLIDIRSAADFRGGHIPSSVAVGANGNLSGWTGWIFTPEKPLLLVAKSGDSGLAQIREATRQLNRIGYDRVVGYIDGGVDIWRAAGREVASLRTTNAAGLAKRLDADELLAVVDVREAAEWHAGHVPGSVNFPAHEIPARAAELPRGVPLAVHCGHDFRATLGASLLERAGFHDLYVLEDGWEGWAGLPAQS